MNFKKIITAFCIGLPLCVLMRILQIIFTIEKENGFFISDFKTYGNLMTVFIAAVCIVLILCAFKAYKKPEKAPRTNIPLSVSAAAVALALVLETFCENAPQSLVPWQVFIIKLITVFTAVYFAVFAVCGFLGVKIPAIVHIVPCVYAIVKTAFTFIGISSLAVISDNVLLMAGYCLLMLFFINYGKLYNGLDTELNFRKILATGLATSVMCAAQSVAYFAVNIVESGRYPHSDASVMFTLLSFAVFIVVFILSHFVETTKKEHI